MTENTDSNSLLPAGSTNIETVHLDVPIIRGDSTIASITLRRPTSGELRGVKLVDLAQIDVSALTIVLPRITMPTLTKQEIERLDPADLTEIGAKVALFLTKRTALLEFQ
jgi:hypothetical protein